MQEVKDETIFKFADDIEELQRRRFVQQIQLLNLTYQTMVESPYLVKVAVPRYSAESEFVKLTNHYS